MKQIAIIGCGVVGATIAYELSQIPDFKVTVFDRQPPAQASTGAALGVLMGIISQKTKGRAWAMRQTSIRRYETLIPELEAVTGHSIPWNRHGILMLCFEDDVPNQWQKLADIRRMQGWQLQLWDTRQVQVRCPQIDSPRLTGGVYSPQDRQVDPTALTWALVTAAEQQGVSFRFGEEIRRLGGVPGHEQEWVCQSLHVGTDSVAVDDVVIAAGLGSTALTQMTTRPVDIRPVLGQAMQVRLEQPLGDRSFQPVITGEDIHIVPLGEGNYWVGATVEFPTREGEVIADDDRLQEVWQGATRLCPDLAKATVLKTWSGLRPRPSDRPAPVIERLAGYRNVLVATGHYRNGVLLAPATALAVREAILGLAT
ncbi:MAG: FAD-dependent oxidoreductase [Elainellaceae cyanobacterium]